MTAPAVLDALGEVVVILEQMPDPRVRSRAIARIAEGLDEAERQLCRLLRDALLELRAETPPPSWAELGDLLGVTAQHVQQLAAGDK